MIDPRRTPARPRLWLIGVLTLGTVSAVVSDARLNGFAEPAAAPSRNQAAADTAAAVVTAIPSEYEEPTGGWAPSCNADLTTCAVRGRKGTDAVVVVNGTAGAAYEEVTSPIFSADGRHVAYAGLRKSAWVVVADGKEGPPFDKIERLRFLGSEPIYIGFRAPAPPTRLGFRNPRTPKIQQYPVVGDRLDEHPFEEERFEELRDFTVSPDGKSYAYAWSVGGGLYGLFFLIVNNEQKAEFNGIRVFSFEPDGSLLYSWRSGTLANGRSTIVLGEKDLIADHPQDVVAAAVRAKNRGLAYVSCGPGAGPARRALIREIGDHCQLTVDGKVVRTGAIDRLQFSPNGATLAYRERQADGQSRITVGDQAGPPADAIPDQIIFSADSKHHAYAAKRGPTSVVVMDGVAGPAFDTVDGLRFSPDSQHLVYSASSKGVYDLVVDQAARNLGAAWVSAPVFSGATVRFVSRDGRNLSRRSLAIAR